MSDSDKIKELETKVAMYEQDGVAKLYYALNRKAGEMADLLNSNNLKNIDIDDPKSKTFERLQKIWKDAGELSSAVKILGETANVTGDEKKDTVRRPFIDTIADKRN